MPPNSDGTSLQLPHADEIADWMAQHGIQKLTLNRIESKNELKIEASQYATVKYELPVEQET